ncbi:MAG TPA: hypothetical protein VK994_07620 [Bacteroidales bacterium]|nr:hypothetical protein [Bacteroidales bacterium]
MKASQEDNIMLIIVDKKIPAKAKENLAGRGKIIELETEGITYEAISGHPDIFFHQATTKLIIAPNLPEAFIGEIIKAGISFIMGEQPVGEKYPSSSAYNAVSTSNLLIHNFRNTDSSITRALEDADLIHVDQGYTRCNLLALNNDRFITSDQGIARVLERFGKDCLFVDPRGIILEGYDHGFFGGCCGMLGKEIYFLGSLKNFPEGEKVTEYAAKAGFGIIELCDGPLFDGGSILFIN